MDMLLKSLVNEVFNSNLEQDVKIAVIERMLTRQKKILKIKAKKHKKDK